MKNVTSKIFRLLNRAVKKHGSDSDKTREAEQTKNLKTYGLELRKKRRDRAKEAIKGIGQGLLR